MTTTDPLIANYLAAAARLNEAVAGMTPGALSARPVPGKWSTLEVLAHLADFEVINTERIKRILAEDNPTLFDADPVPFAARLAYDRRDPDVELQLISTLRRHVAGLLERLDPQQWARTGTHSTDGPVSVRDIVTRTTNHVNHHLQFIAEKRAALGK